MRARGDPTGQSRIGLGAITPSMASDARTLCPKRQRGARRRRAAHQVGWNVSVGYILLRRRRALRPTRAVPRRAREAGSGTPGGGGGAGAFSTTVLVIDETLPP